MFFIIFGEIDYNFHKNFVIEITDSYISLGENKRAKTFETEKEAIKWIRDDMHFAYPDGNFKILSEDEILVLNVII